MLQLRLSLDDVRNLKHKVLRELKAKCPMGCSGSYQHNAGPCFSENGLCCAAEKAGCFITLNMYQVADSGV